MSTDTRPVVAGEPLSPDPTEWTTAQIEAMLPQAVGKADMKAIEGLIMLLALKDPHRAQEVMDTLKVGLMLAKERDGV